MRVGSLFTGVLGLDWPWLGFEHAWVSEIDADAVTVLEKRLPGVLNLGDITQVDWSNVPSVDVLIGGGFPCQPFSQAGRRLGEFDERYLWPEVVRSIRDLRPGLVVLENTPTVVARGDGLPRFAGDLATIGYDLRWTSLRAADVGAPHARRRWLAVAYPCGELGWEHTGHPLGTEAGPDPTDEPGRTGEGRLLPTPNAWDGARGPDYARAERDEAGGDDLVTIAARLLPTPTARDHKGPFSTGDGVDLPDAVSRLLPTPIARDWKGVGMAGQLPTEIDRLLPTPVAVDARGARNATLERKPGKAPSTGWTISDVAHAERWGEYVDAINRWMSVMGYPPDPVNEARRLEAPFVEWMMGFPPGWVTDLVPRRAALRLLGNAVMPHVAYAALQGLTRVC